ncbi:hypothetical protein AAOGI_06740 [Agarivorans albus]
MLIPENGNYGVTVNTPQPLQVKIEVGTNTLMIAAALLVLMAAWIKKKGK